MKSMTATSRSMTASRILLSLSMIAVMGIVAGCGRKAPLDTPYQAAINDRKEAEDNKEPLPPEPEKPVVDKPFILDGLID